MHYINKAEGLVKTVSEDNTDIEIHPGMITEFLGMPVEIKHIGNYDNIIIVEVIKTKVQLKETV